MIARHKWLRDRVSHCVMSMKKLEEKEDWREFITLAGIIANEMGYAAKEWENYYKEKENAQSSEDII